MRESFIFSIPMDNCDKIKSSNFDETNRQRISTCSSSRESKITRRTIPSSTLVYVHVLLRVLNISFYHFSFFSHFSFYFYFFYTKGAMNSNLWFLRATRKRKQWLTSWCHDRKPTKTRMCQIPNYPTQICARTSTRQYRSNFYSIFFFFFFSFFQITSRILLEQLILNPNFLISFESSLFLCNR